MGSGGSWAAADRKEPPDGRFGLRSYDKRVGGRVHDDEVASVFDKVVLPAELLRGGRFICYQDSDRAPTLFRGLGNPDEGSQVGVSVFSIRGGDIGVSRYRLKELSRDVAVAPVVRELEDIDVQAAVRGEQSCFV